MCYAFLETTLKKIINFQTKKDNAVNINRNTCLSDETEADLKSISFWYHFILILSLGR